MLRRRDVHIPYRWLVDLHDGVLDPGRTDEARSHLQAGCGRCTGHAESIARVVTSLRAGPLESPTRTALAAAVATVRAAARATSGATRPLETVGVTLATRDAPAALRDAPGASRRLLFRAGPFEIDLAVMARPDGRFDLFGQVLPDRDDPESTIRARLELHSATGRVRQLAVAPSGRFTVRSLRRGPVVLAGDAGEGPFRLPPVVLDA